MAFPGILNATLIHAYERKFAQDFLICRIIWLRLNYFFHLLFHFAIESILYLRHNAPLYAQRDFKAQTILNRRNIENAPN